MSQLLCKVEKGPMAHEVAIIVRGMDKEYESWADAKDISPPSDADRHPGEGLVPVRVIAEDAEHGRVLVELPAEVVMGSRRIWVPVSQLRR